MRARSGRRGSNAIEFAMLFPLFLAIASVIMEYGLYFYAHTNMISAVRGGCCASRCRSSAAVRAERDPAAGRKRTSAPGSK